MVPDARFIPGVELSHKQAMVMEPPLRLRFSRTPLALALIGAGSDVLGYDSARSMDHDWGPRVTIVVPDEDLVAVRDAINAEIDVMLPSHIEGFPTRFSLHDDGTMRADPAGSLHRIDVTSIRQLLRTHLSIDAVEEIDTSVILSTPMQNLLELTAGRVHLDDTGELTRLRNRLAFYPEDIWRYQLAALWMRIGQVQPFIGRTGESGDATGSATIAAGVAKDMMRLCLLQSRIYAPYAKWIGTACARTEVGEQMVPHLQLALTAPDWHDRELGINAAGALLIEQLNRLHLITEVLPEPAQFHSRPYMVLPAEQIAHALSESLVGTPCAKLSAFVGGVGAITDSTDALKNPEFLRAFRMMIAANVS